MNAGLEDALAEVIPLIDALTGDAIDRLHDQGAARLHLACVDRIEEQAEVADQGIEPLESGDTLVRLQAVVEGPAVASTVGVAEFSLPADAVTFLLLLRRKPDVRESDLHGSLSSRKSPRSGK